MQTTQSTSNTSPSKFSSNLVLRGVLAVLVVVQVVAFWMVCTDQVQSAQQRHVEWSQRTALDDKPYHTRSVMSSSAQRGSANSILSMDTVTGGSTRMVNFTR